MEKEALLRLSTLSHPQRLGIFRLLMRRYPDQVPAGEIASALTLKASTTSVYLAALTDAGLIRQRRQGTSLRYSANTQAAGALINFLVVDCCRGRPELCAPVATATLRSQYNVLFLCTGNSARSICAQTILRDLDPTRFAVYSAGTQPNDQINPLAVDILTCKGHDTARLRPQPMSDFQTPDSPRMDFVFTVCNSAANEDCPTWEGQPISGHWGLPDPASAKGPLAERRRAFEHTYTALHARIAAFAALPLATLDATSLQNAIDAIGIAPPKGHSA